MCSSSEVQRSFEIKLQGGVLHTTLGAGFDDEFIAHYKAKVQTPETWNPGHPETVLHGLRIPGAVSVPWAPSPLKTKTHASEAVCTNSFFGQRSPLFCGVVGRGRDAFAGADYFSSTYSPIVAIMVSGQIWRFQEL